MIDNLLLPEGARLLHIGPHKTGSTAIQVAMFRARPKLAAHGVYYPVRTRRRREASKELRAAIKDGTSEGTLKRWDAFCREVSAADATRVCVSDEEFGKASDEAAARIVHDLGGREPHIVIVARRLDAYLPSQWQERVKSGVCESYDSWLRIVLADEVRQYEHTNVWRSHDLTTIVDRWAEHVGPDRVTLIISDESDRTQLPRVFEAMLGLPQETLELDPDRSNQSLALAEVEMFRAVNDALSQQGWSRRDYMPWLKPAVRAVAAYGGETTGPRRAPMPAWASSVVRDLNDSRVTAVQALPIRVVGDPEWLRGEPWEEGDVDTMQLHTPIALAATVVARITEAALTTGTDKPKRPGASSG